MTGHRLAIAFWISAILGIGLWWGLSYRYGIGFAAAGPAISASAPTRHAHPKSGVACVSGVGKVVFYLSWASSFTRQGIIFEPVLAHEFPHPWIGFQKEGGRIWLSFPVGAVFGFTLLGAIWNLFGKRKRQ